jgi:hypothetical protein
MAITFIKAPQKYTPSNNDILFQVESDSLNLAYFIAEVKNSAGTIISKLKIRPTPLYKKGAFFNLTNILTTQTTLVKTDNIVEYTTDVQAYSVRVTTYSNDVSLGVLPTGDENTYTGTFIFNGQLPMDIFSSYDYTSYVATATGVGRFLTNKPVQTNIAPIGTEYLYYLNDARANKVQFKFYYVSGTVVTKNVAVTVSQKLGRINISPLVLEATGTDLTDLQYYTVALLDSANATAVQPVYRYLKITPSITNLQMYWKNDLGGVDTYLFKNIRESISNIKITAKGSPYKLSSTNVYGDNDKNIYYPTDVNLQSDTITTYTVVSEYLTNEEAKWITGIISSKEVFVLLQNGKVYPVQVKDTGATIQNTRYTGQLNQFEVSFTAPSTGTTGLSLQNFTGEEYFPYVLPITFV